MHIEKRRLHPEQIARQPQLAERQKVLYDLYWSKDLEIYDDNGELIAITSRDNPNLSRVLADIRCQELTTGGHS